MKRKAFDLVWQSAILVPFILAGLSCKYLSETADQVGKDDPIPLSTTTDEATLWLNGERVGNLGDVEALREKVTALIKERENNSVFVEGTIQWNKDVYFIVNTNLPLRTAYLLQNTADTRRYWPTESTKILEGDPDPLLLTIMVQDTSAPKPTIPNYPSHLSFEEMNAGTIRLNITKVLKEGSESEQARSNHFDLISEGGLEIDRNGRLSFIIPYPREQLWESKDIYEFEVNRQAAGSENLKRDFEALFPECSIFHIYADENLGLLDLRGVLKSLGETRCEYNVRLTRNGQLSLKERELITNRPPWRFLRRAQTSSFASTLEGMEFGRVIW